ncbi:permease prefix domain 1-containing protein [Janibacter limosus]|jgi:hypothetical protein|uniref:Uncharacterized protein n=1 Tax=Janibacter limosus TaxID=53458 RepID=A0A4P6MQJ5_9MICO|nr:permease prefix domain 1-containing protein [Janibacter limosus]QBF44986.1 hypothetical protein EXU32_01080 [Janibacter limosus]
MTASTSLTDRYVWTVTRQLPPESGPDVAQELRGSIEETVEGRIAAGEEPATAERETILGLGDPDVLAREYGGRPNHLIGPAYFPAWVRLVKLLLVVIVPLAVVGNVIARSFGSDADFGAVIGGAAALAFQTAVHLVFWTALIFALVERSAGPLGRDRLVADWNPDELADPADRARRASLGEMVFEVVWTVVVIAVAIWQWRGVGEGAVQVLDPDLAVGWQVLIIGLLALDVVVTVAAWARGGWSVALASISLVSAVTSGAALVWLLLGEQLLTDVPTEAAAALGVGADWTLSLPAVAVGIVLVCGWEAVTAVRRMRDAKRSDAQ